MLDDVLNRLWDEDQDEPARKVRIIEHDEKPESRKPTLCDLPPEMLQMILGNVNIWHHNRIRAISRTMRDSCDALVMHNFKKELHQSKMRDPFSSKTAKLYVIQKATEVYTRYGYESTFSGCLLPMLRSSYKNEDPFCPSITKLNDFLKHFYDCVKDRIGSQNSQKARLLYAMTLMRFFKLFNNATIISSINYPLHWRIVIELQGQWLGILWSPKIGLLDFPEKRSHLLVILTNMLLANVTGIPFKRVGEYATDIYVYGHAFGNSNTQRIPKSIFTFTVHGTKRIISLFRACCERGEDNFIWPNKLPKDQFSMDMDVTCKEAMKWGCSKSQHMGFGPFGEVPYCDNEDDNFDGYALQ